MTVGTKLRHYRKLVNKSQQCLSDETGIPQTTISNWENGIGEPTASDIPKLALALGVFVNDLLTSESDYSEVKLESR